MGYPLCNCEDEQYTCTAWSGKGNLRRDLLVECPTDKNKCEYRKKKTIINPPPCGIKHET